MSPLHLVTGGSGYFGCLLVEQLRSRGCAVRVFDRADAHDRPRDVDFVQGDIRDERSIRQACEGVDVVYHNVALVPLAKDREAFWSVNRDGTRNLLRASREAKVAKVIHTSSSAVFGIPKSNPVDESVDPAPMEDYGKAKLAAEEHCRAFAKEGLDVTIVRPRTIMGHGRLGVMQIIFEWTRQGRNLPVLGRGDNVYQFVHAEDLADACIKAAARSGPSVLNIGAENYCSMRETLEGLVKHAGTGSKVVSLPMGPTVALMKLTSALGLSPLGPYHALMYGRSLYFDITKAKEELDWQPKYGNVEMFCQSYDWYIEHRSEVFMGREASHHRSAVRQGILRLGSAILSLF
ncbi:NAD-dependent epimerase/dehydratase family protein [Candidatus Sumerlaeota bacterium]|nr:NAD-dependent epimerase/dehydratase family protein [Candidatus Sumerlaeota bacterium]